VARLTGPEIVRQIGLGNIVIRPFNPAHVNPNSYDLCLGPKLKMYQTVRGYSHPITGKQFAFPRWDDRQSAADRAAQWDKDAVEANSALRPPPIFVDDWAHLDMAHDNPTDEIEIPETGLVLFPNTLYLGSTAEYTETHGFLPCLETKSSLARLGLSCHLSAGFGDHGFSNYWTYEITVVHPLRVYAGKRIAQIVYDTLVGEHAPYAGRYQDQDAAESKPTASKVWQDFHE
jgi:dCTP deaminase